jgi:hypothetical protein
MLQAQCTWSVSYVPTDLYSTKTQDGRLSPDAGIMPNEYSERVVGLRVEILTRNFINTKLSAIQYTVFCYQWAYNF